MHCGCVEMCYSSFVMRGNQQRYVMMITCGVSAGVCSLACVTRRQTIVQEILVNCAHENIVYLRTLVPYNVIGIYRETQSRNYDGRNVISMFYHSIEFCLYFRSRMIYCIHSKITVYIITLLNKR